MNFIVICVCVCVFLCVWEVWINSNQSLIMQKEKKNYELFQVKFLCI